jgi:hypothetical protein
MADKNRKQQKATLSPITGLTPQQEQACILLAGGESYTNVARQLNINRSTLYDWQNNLAFICFFNQQCKEHKQEVKNALLGLHRQAINALTGLLTNGNENTRLKASIWLLERLDCIEVGKTDLKAALKEQSYDVNINMDAFIDRQQYMSALRAYGLTDE